MRENKRSVKHLKATAEFYLPSLGITADVKPEGLAVWIAAGKVPDGLLAAMAKAQAQNVEIKPQEMPGWMDFAIELAKDRFVWPRVVDSADPDSDDELEPRHIPDTDLSRFLAWVLAGSPRSTVRLRGGEVSAEALKSFRQDAELSGGGEGGGEVRAEAVSDAGDSGRDDGTES